MDNFWNSLEWDLYIGDSGGNKWKKRGVEVLGIRRGDPRYRGLPARIRIRYGYVKRGRFYDRNNVMYFFFFLSFFFFRNFLTNMIAKFVGFLVEKSRK